MTSSDPSAEATGSNPGANATTSKEASSTIYMTHHHHHHSQPPAPSKSGSSTPPSHHLLRTPSSTGEKSYDQLQRVKDEDKQAIEYDIHCTCCEGPHQHGGTPIPLKRKESRDASICIPHSPLSPARTPISPPTPTAQEPCKNCEGCKKDGKEW